MLPRDRRPVSGRIEGKVLAPVALCLLDEAELFACQGEIEMRVSEPGVESDRVPEKDERPFVVALAVKEVADAPLLTTAEMAERLAISTKTLLKRKKVGLVRPALEHGRLIRWKTDEHTR
jgi:hypothetical protein